MPKQPSDSIEVDEDDEFKNERDQAIIPLVRKYKDHPRVTRTVSIYRKPGYRVAKNPEDTTGRYLQEAGQFRLLSQLDEQDLFMAIEKGLQINELLEISGNTPTHEEEQLLIDLVAAHEVIFNCNLRLVISIAKKYAMFNPTIPMIDFIQEGNLGLGMAIRRTDISKGLKFSTYATQWVRQGITRSIGDKSRLIRMPVHLHEQYMKYQVELSKLTNELDRDPTLEEIIEATGHTKKQVLTFMQFGPSEVRSLDAELDDDTNLHNKLSDENAWSLETFVEAEAQSEDIDAIFSGPISEREKLVISLRFGVFREQLAHFGFGEQSYEDVIQEGPKTLDEVGQLIGVTRERIRQIEKKAMDIVRDRVF